MRFCGLYSTPTYRSYSFTCPNFIGAFVHERHRTNYMTFLYTSVYTGVALGPILGAALASPQLTNFLNRFGKAFNQNNLPGYFMAIVWLLMLATEEPYGHNDDMELVFFCFGRPRHAPDSPIRSRSLALQSSQNPMLCWRPPMH